MAQIVQKESDGLMALGTVLLFPAFSFADGK